MHVVIPAELTSGHGLGVDTGAGCPAGSRPRRGARAGGRRAGRPGPRRGRGRLRRRREDRPRALRRAGHRHPRLGADGHRAGRRGAARAAARVARGRRRRVHRERDDRRIDPARRRRRGREHARGGRRRAAPPAGRIPARARPRPRRARARRPGRDRQHDDQCHERGDSAPDREPHLDRRLRVEVGALVDGRRHGRPRRRAAHPRLGDDAPARAVPLAADRGGDAARGARGRRVHGLLQRLALPHPALPAADLGRPPLPPARRGHGELPLRGDRRRGGGARERPLRAPHRDGDGRDPGGAARRGHRQPDDPRGRPVRARHGRAAACERQRLARGGAGGGPHRQLGVEHPGRPDHVVGRAVPAVRRSSRAAAWTTRPTWRASTPTTRPGRAISSRARTRKAARSRSTTASSATTAPSAGCTAEAGS